MGEVVSGLRFRKNHIVPQPTHPRGLHDQRGSPDPTGRGSSPRTILELRDHSGPGWTITPDPLYRLCDHPDLHDQRGLPGPDRGGSSPRTVLELRDHPDPGGRSLLTPCIDCVITPTRTVRADYPDPAGGIPTPDYASDSIIYMYIQ